MNYSEENSQILVNLGCGPIQPKGWINVDYSNRARLAKYFPIIDKTLTRMRIIPPTEFTKDTTVFDVRKKLPFKDSSITGIYAGELWEHLLPKDAYKLMHKCYNALIPGGHLRVNVPDNYGFWKRYCKAHEDMMKKPRESWDDGYSTKNISMFWEYICTSRPFLGSMGHFHKWAYDEVSLTLQFERVGFTKVKKKGLHDSGIPDIEAVEERAFLTIEGEKL